MNECTKVTLICSLCKDKFRRPWLKYHDCRRVLLDRLSEADMKISYQFDKIAEKTRKIAELQSKSKHHKASKMDMRIIDN